MLPKKSKKTMENAQSGLGFVKLTKISIEIPKMFVYNVFVVVF